MENDKFQFSKMDDEVFNMVNENHIKQKNIRENSIISNNKFNRENSVVGKKKKKKVNIKTIALASIVAGIIINQAAIALSKNNIAVKHVENSFDDVNLPYHYVTSYDGNYFYDSGNVIDLSQGVKEIVNDLTKQGASLEDIYYYLDINYGSSMVNVYKSELKKNNQELHLNEYKDMLYHQDKYLEDKSEYEGKVK